MTKHEFKLLVILAAAHRGMMALEVKKTGRYWFLPWGVMHDMLDKGWVKRFQTMEQGTPWEVPVPSYWTITDLGRKELHDEFERRSKA